MLDGMRYETLRLNDQDFGSKEVFDDQYNIRARVHDAHGTCPSRNELLVLRVCLIYLHIIAYTEVVWDNLGFPVMGLLRIGSLHLVARTYFLMHLV